MNAFDFVIPEHNLNALENRISILNKKADKLNAPNILLEVGESFVRKNKRYTNIKVVGETPVINGWSFSASIEYIDSGTIIKSPVRGFKAPSKYVNAEPFCEHCNTRKVKKFTYLLENIDTGEFINVGRTCLKDFLCLSIDAEISRFTYFMSIIDELSDPDSDYYGEGGGELYYSVEMILAYAHIAIKDSGYKRSDEEYSTKEAVAYMIREGIALSEENYQFAKDVIEYVKNSDSDSDYMTNVKNLVEVGDITFRMFGILIGAVAGYLKEQTRKLTESKLLDEYFGDVKVRYTLNLTLTFLSTFDSYYGTTFIHGFVDADGRTYVWFGSKLLHIDVEVGDTVKVKATVKGHELYKGRKQTQLTRVSLV